TAGIEPSLGPLATAYVLILVVVGPLTARWTEPLALRLTSRLRRPVPAVEAVPLETVEDPDTVGR
ncbi:cation:proton antiporter, partial [Streptomyces sp. NPDC026672]